MSSEINRRGWLFSISHSLAAAFGWMVGRSVIFPVSTQSGLGTKSHPFYDKFSTGPLDQLPSRLLYARHAVSSVLRSAFPGYSVCGRCKWPWAVVREHSTMFETGDDGFSGSGCFPLCEDCWVELQTAGNRMPYYMQLVNEWGDQNQVREKIRKAVERGL